MSKKARKAPPTLQLGRAVEWPRTPEQAKLDRVPNPQDDTNYMVRFTAPEFTSLFPVTGQPDFAHLVIDYVPGEWLLESKSLKLYVASFRDQAQMAAHRRLLVSAGRHSDRRVLASRQATAGNVDSRSGCGAVSRARVS